MKKNRCVVLGSSGFIGGYLVRELIKNDFPVVAVGRNAERLKKGLSHLENKVEFRVCDFLDTKKNVYYLKKNDIVFDLITSSVPATSVKEPIKEITNNIAPHADFFMQACEKQVGRVIFTSSGGSIYGDLGTRPFLETDLPNPQSPHAIGKLATEYFLKYFCKSSQIPHTIFRISNPFGEGQQKIDGFGVIPTFLEKVKKNSPPILFNKGNLLRDFIHIQDVVEAMVLSLTKHNNYSIYNIGSGQGLTIKEVWDIIKETSGSDLSPIFTEGRPFDVKEIVLDISRFSEEFSWRPRFDIKKSLKKLAGFPS